MGHLQPLIIFLKQEIDRMQRVITMTRVTLTDLKLAIEGTIIMSENLRDALDNMFDARVPALWRRISWQSSTLGFWFTELLERNDQFFKWVFEGRPPAFWMTGFFNPQGKYQLSYKFQLKSVPQEDKFMIVCFLQLACQLTKEWLDVLKFD